MYPALAVVFALTLIAGALIVSGFIIPPVRKRLGRSAKIYTVWLIFYCGFILFGTGPNKEDRPENLVGEFPARSPYKLPWLAGEERFVSQGNRSFTSHRGRHLYAWDFWMKMGSEVLAARSGRVIDIEQRFDGIGLHSNFVTVEHEDGSRAIYAHIKKNGAVVEKGDIVKQGGHIAYSGMVGQTLNPHLHFVVFDSEGRTSLPIVFADVPGGVPLAGRFYRSANEPAR